MGEARKAQERQAQIAAIASTVTGEAADRGDLLETGFAAFALNGGFVGQLSSADVARLRDLRFAYMASAEQRRNS